MVCKFQVEYGAGLTFDHNAGSGERGFGRPARSWLDLGMLNGGRPRVIDFVGRHRCDSSSRWRTRRVLYFESVGSPQSFLSSSNITGSCFAS